MIEPHLYTSDARTASPVQVIHIDGAALRQRCAEDPTPGMPFVQSGR